MGHLLSTSQRVAREEESAKAYSEYSAGAGREPVASDGWQPAGPQLMAEPSQDEIDDIRRQGIPGGIQYITDAQLGVADRPPLPEVGHWVLFHLRAGDARNRRTKFPALVMDVDHERRQLELMVVVDANDTWMQERVTERVPNEQGWERIPTDLQHTINAEAITGLVGRVNELVRMVEAMMLRLDRIENETGTAPLIAETPAVSAEMRGVHDGRETATAARQRKRRG